MVDRENCENTFCNEVQVDDVNASGFLRTNDHLLPSAVRNRDEPQHRAAQSKRRGRCKASVKGGPGAWKQWTPQAIARAVFSKRGMTARNSAALIHGASHGQILRLRKAVANVICSAQRQSLERLWNASLESPLALVVVSNIMFDETKLPLSCTSSISKKPIYRKWSVLASHGQLTCVSSAGVIEELGMFERVSGG